MDFEPLGYFGVYVPTINARACGGDVYGRYDYASV